MIRRFLTWSRGPRSDFASVFVPGSSVCPSSLVVLTPVSISSTWGSLGSQVLESCRRDSRSRCLPDFVRPGRPLSYRLCPTLSSSSPVPRYSTLGFWVPTPWCQVIRTGPGSSVSFLGPGVGESVLDRETGGRPLESVRVTTPSLKMSIPPVSASLSGDRGLTCPHSPPRPGEVRQGQEADFSAESSADGEGGGGAGHEPVRP